MNSSTSGWLVLTRNLVAGFDPQNDNFMNEGKVTIERRGHVLLIGLDRVPKRNAFDVAMYHDLATAYGTLDRDQDLRCGMLFAHGDISPLALTWRNGRRC
jgi:hypothetical protein